MLLARAIHFDESDQRVYFNPARTGEWAISGGFEFSNWSEADLTGKARQAFANGWLGVETFGRVTFVAVTTIEPAEVEALTDALAQHFVDVYGAPSWEAARPVASGTTARVSVSTRRFSSQKSSIVLTHTREAMSMGIYAASTRTFLNTSLP